MINNYPINKIWNQKDNCLFHNCMLKLNESHMNAIHVQMMNQQKYNEGGSIIIIFNLMDIYINKNMFPT
jgi:hypothetical protein